MERTWEITDLDGGNRRTVTLAQYQAELSAGRAAARRVWQEYAAAPNRTPEQREFADNMIAKL